ncbi:MAG: tetratricopeptide repeat protein [Rhodobacteraceae bacterium]|nr:tetratricopeptide repeat protein [Paracoccaceae bacterium]
MTTPVLAQNSELDPLFESLRDADPDAARQIEERIWVEWSKSGSPAMDMLLDRGREALEAGDAKIAVEHFSALIDHAPEFAEGYNARALAYYQLDLYGPAVADIQQTLALNPRHFGALSGLAVIFEEAGMTEGALEAWRAVEALHPNREGLEGAIKRLERQVEGRAL